MVQHLQNLVGKTESDADALAGWRSMSDGERQTTKTAYKATGGPKL